jgi:hypothetical protein
MREMLSIGQQAVAQIPWGHNFIILNKRKRHDKDMFYVQKTIHNNWFRTESDIPIFYLKSDFSIWKKLSAKLKFQFFRISEYRLYLTSITVFKKKWQEWIEQQEGVE